MARPDLTDPTQRAAYLAERRQLARGVQTAGLTLATLGLILAIVRAAWLPKLPALVPVTVIALALGMILIGMVRRARWHLAQRRP